MMMTIDDYIVLQMNLGSTLELDISKRKKG